METTTTVIKAWHTNPERLREADLGDPDRLSFTNHDMSTTGWLEVGFAEIKLTRTLNRQEVVLAMVEKLEQDIQKVQADAYVKTTDMRARINDLLMLVHEPEGARDDQF